MRRPSLLRTRRVAAVVALAVGVLAAAATTAPAAPALLAGWGSAGSGPGQFGSGGFGIAAARSGPIAVADSGNHRMQVFSPSGVLLTSWGALGTGGPRLNRPTGVAEAAGVLYATESAGARVHAFTLDGVYLRSWGGQGTGLGKFDGPMGIAVGPDGTVVVADTGNGRLQAFDSMGGSARELAADALVEPVGVAVGPTGDIYATDRSTRRVLRIDPATGGVVSTWTAGTGGALGSPSGVAVDPEDLVVHVADTSRHKVATFTATGTPVDEWGTQGSAPGQLNGPTGLAVDCQLAVYVFDAGNHRIQRFGAAGTREPPCNPVAAFSWSPQSPLVDEPVALDGSASAAAARRFLVKYEWDLDGNGSFETDTADVPHVTASWAGAGTVPVSLRVTDDRGVQGTSTQSITVAAPPPPPGPEPPPPPPPEPEPQVIAASVEPPQPMRGVSALARRLAGTVRARRPGSRRFTTLPGGQTLLPIGTVIDASAGRVQLTFATEPGPRPDTQTGQFTSGAFQMFQSSRSALTELLLAAGTQASSSERAKASRHTRRRKRSSRRRLWSRARGRFRTRGRNAAATIRGTRWLTEDTALGTRVRVADGIVDVRDLVRGRTVRLRKGQSYYAKDPCHSRRRFRIRLQVPPGVQVRKAIVRLAGKRVRVRRNMTATIDLRGKRRRTYTVRIEVHTMDGQKLTGVRRYRTCSTGRTRSAPPRL